MLKRISLSPLLALAGAHAVHDHGGGNVGVHGMVAFGGANGTVFFSHIPMFHPPHARQLVFQAKLAGNHDFGQGLFTFQPKPFSLDDLVAGKLRTIEGTVFRGNFESGGKPIEDVSISVERTLASAPLSSQTPPSGSLEYFLIGNRRDAYLVHRIAAPPSFDQVVKLDLTKSTLTDDELASGVTVSFPGRADDVAQRLKAGAWDGRVAGSKRGVRVWVERVLSELVGPDFTAPP